MTDEVYLGDGLYASFNGFQYCLRAPRLTGDHIVYIDAPTMKAFDEYRKKVDRLVSDVLATQQINDELGKLQAGEPSITDGKR